MKTIKHMKIVSLKTFMPFMLFMVSFEGLAAAQFGPPLQVPPPGAAATERVPILKDVGVTQKLNTTLPLDLVFNDETGREVRLGEFFGARPVLLVLAYYECPMLCSEVLSGMVGSIETLSFNAGRDFDVVVASFDPGETPAMAAAKKQFYMTRYGRRGTEGGFHFLTGRESSIKALTQAVGFQYVYDAKIDQYAHPAMLTILTPHGTISRYLFGIDFPARDLRLALVEAADGKIGNAVDQALLYCYHYDPMSGSYGLAILNVVRVGGVLVLAALAAFVITNLRRERRHAQAAHASAATGIR
jgi:protein SCO1/2